MKLILTNMCKSLSGTIYPGTGYHLEHRKNGVFAKRNRTGLIPPDGHWCFIVRCAQLAQQLLYIADIKIDWLELQEALYEAQHFTASYQVRLNYCNRRKATYDAQDVLNLKVTFGL